MSKRDYYEVLGVAEDGERRRAQERVPQAGDEVPPGSQSRRQGGRRAVQGSGRGLRACSPTPRSAAAYDRFGHAGVRAAAGGGPGFDPSVFSEFGDFADILGNMFGFGDIFGGGRRRGGPQRGADLRYDLEISFEEAAKGTETDDPDSAPGIVRDVHRLRRGAGLLARAPARSATARARSASSRASSPSRARVPQCRGAGKIITKPCATCRGAGRVATERKITVKIPAGIATGQQLRLQNEGEGGSARRPAGPSLRRRPRAGARVLPARRHQSVLRNSR